MFLIISILETQPETNVFPKLIDTPESQSHRNMLTLRSFNRMVEHPLYRDQDSWKHLRRITVILSLIRPIHLFIRLYTFRLRYHTADCRASLRYLLQ